MRRKYSVLWEPSLGEVRSSGSAALGSTASGPGHGRLTVEELDESEAKKLIENKQARALAPAMRTFLFQPFEAKSDDAEQGAAWGGEAVGALDHAEDGKGIRIAVLDTGIESQHPAFCGVKIHAEDFSSSGSVEDGNGHGTHCAGTIFGRDVEGERIGIARGIEDVLIGKVLDDAGAGDTDMLYRGLRWAIESEAQIISMSLGFDYPGEVRDLIDGGLPPELAASQALESFRQNAKMLEGVIGLAIARRELKTDPLIVAAAGNESQRDRDASFVIGASLPSVVCDLSVGAVGRENDRYRVAYFSNGNPDVVAPGVSIRSAWIGGGLHTISGTSMACPHVAGVAALWAARLKKGDKQYSGIALRSHLIAHVRRNVILDPNALDVGEGLVTSPS